MIDWNLKNIALAALAVFSAWLTLGCLAWWLVVGQPWRRRR